MCILYYSIVIVFLCYYQYFIIFLLFVRKRMTILSCSHMTCDCPKALSSISHVRNVKKKHGLKAMNTPP